jgi:hypothetical protein
MCATLIILGYKRFKMLVQVGGDDETMTRKINPLEIIDAAFLLLGGRIVLVIAGYLKERCGLLGE